MKKVSKKTLSFMLVFVASVYVFLPQNIISDEKTPFDDIKTEDVNNKTIIPNIFNIIKNDNKQIPQEKLLFEYIEIVDSCNSYFVGDCVNVRSGPGTEYDVVSRLRNGVVLKVGEKVKYNGEEWYKITFDEWLRYEERVSQDWYVSALYVKSFFDEGDKELADDEISTSTKRIIVDRSDQMLYAYDKGQLFIEQSISTGLEISPTPRGIFRVYKKTPSRYMQGPIPGISEKEYDLPGVPWNLYFTKEGAVIHGAYWHDKFGQQWSSGCVNLSSDKAKELYRWADLGTEILVRD